MILIYVIAAAMIATLLGTVALAWREQCRLDRLFRVFVSYRHMKAAGQLGGEIIDWSKGPKA